MLTEVVCVEFRADCTAMRFMLEIILKRKSNQIKSELAVRTQWIFTLESNWSVPIKYYEQ